MSRAFGMPAWVRSALVAGAVYFGIVYPVGFALGAVRVLATAPRLGETVAVLIEAPLILTVSWLASQRCVARFGVPPMTAARLVMGLAAFGLLMTSEFSLALLAFGRSAADQMAGFRSPGGAIGLAAQVAFGLFPLLSTAERRREG